MMKDMRYFDISQEIEEHFSNVQNELLKKLDEKFNDSTFCIDKDELKTMMFDIIKYEFKEEISHPDKDPVSMPMALVTATLMRLYCELERRQLNGKKD